MGCEIGRHSWSHSNLRKISAQERKKEKLGVPKTAEEAMELAKEVKAEKKKFQKRF